MDQSQFSTLDLPKDLRLVSDPDDSVSYEAAMKEVWSCGRRRCGHVGGGLAGKWDDCSLSNIFNMCVSMCVYVCVSMSMCVYACVCPCVCVCVNLCVRVCVCVCVCVL